MRNYVENTVMILWKFHPNKHFIVAYPLSALKLFPADYMNYLYRGKNCPMEEEPTEVMIANLSNHLQVYIKLNAQYVAGYFVIHMKLCVVATASATHAANESRRTALAHGAGRENMKSEKIRA